MTRSQCAAAATTSVATPVPTTAAVPAAIRLAIAAARLVAAVLATGNRAYTSNDHRTNQGAAMAPFSFSLGNCLTGNDTCRIFRSTKRTKPRRAKAMKNYAANVYAAFAAEVERHPKGSSPRLAKLRRTAKLARLFVMAGGVRAAFGPL